MKQQRLVAFAILMFCLFNTPILSLFNKKTFIMGIPSIYLYVFSVWLIGIIVVAILSEKNKKDSKTDE